MRDSLLLCGALVGVSGKVSARHGELPNRIPEAAPYDTEEAKSHPPPYDAYFSGSGNPRVCGQCHQRIFEEWNGSMMSNSWRDPAWRAAFFLLSRLTATDGNCDLPSPPDGTKKSRLNPFANPDCTSTFDLGTQAVTTKGPGSLLDGFCSRCHMPANYMDAIQPKNVRRDAATGLEHGLVDPDFDPTSARGTAFAFATVSAQFRNTEAGKLGLTCTFCHTIAETRETPFHNHSRTGALYAPAVGKGVRAATLTPELAEMVKPPDETSATLGFTVGAGAYRISPQALEGPERFGPLTHARIGTLPDSYVSGTFGRQVLRQESNFAGSIHKGNYSVLFERAEMCGTCHDVTNALTIKNALGRWVGGFPIERTYSEWASSRYADRPHNDHFDPEKKRDCQTCHMQQDFGKPGTAQTLFDAHGSVAPLTGKVALTGPERPAYYSHHFVGGNTYSSRLVGADVDARGKAAPYPELSTYSFSSADPDSPYHVAHFENVADHGAATQHARLAWDRLRHAVTLELGTPKEAAAGGLAEVRLRVTNTGAGHDFPTGFPEGRNAWVALRAFDLHTGDELQIADSFWKRRSSGIGYLTSRDGLDPNFPGCKWEVPAGGPDPYAYQFRAVASLGDGCPTLELPYATPLNLVVDGRGLPIDSQGHVIGRENPHGLPQFKDTDGDGDIYDDAFLVDTRLRPLPNSGASIDLDRYSVVIPEGTLGPISVTSAVYYQSMEAVVAKKLLGNLADTDGDHVLEPCVLRGPCDGRKPTVEPAVVEGAPPVPIAVRSELINVEGESDTTPPAVSVYPEPFDLSASTDVVPKVTASEPVHGIDETTFQMRDAAGARVPASVAEIADHAFALFPDRVFLEAGATYFVRLSGNICDFNENCVKADRAWSFTVAGPGQGGVTDTRPPVPPSPIDVTRKRTGSERTVAGMFLPRWHFVSAITALVVLLVTWLATGVRRPRGRLW